MQQRITQITLAGEGSPIYVVGNYAITIVDESGGEFIEVAELQSADAPKIRIYKSEWPTFRDAIDRMMDRVRCDGQAEDAEEPWRDPLTEKFKEQDSERLAGTGQGPQAIDLPESVFRLVAIGIHAERYASAGHVFDFDDLKGLNGCRKDTIVCGQKRVAELIAEAKS